MNSATYFKWKTKQNKRKNRLETEHLKSKIVQNNLTLYFSWCHVFFEKRLDKQMKIDDSTITYVLFLHENKICKVLQIQSTLSALIFYNVRDKILWDKFIFSSIKPKHDHRLTFCKPEIILKQNKINSVFICRTISCHIMA